MSLKKTGLKNTRLNVMNYREAVKKLTPATYLQFKKSLEVGKWPDGTLVSEEQKAHLMQAVILYENIHRSNEEKTGEISDRCRSKSESADEHMDDDKPLRWQ